MNLKAYKNKKVWLCPLLVSLLSGCISWPSQPENAAYVDVFPVEHSLSLQGGKANLSVSMAKLESFLQEFNAQLVSQKVALYWRSPVGDVLKKHAQQRLYALGVSPANIQSAALSDEHGTRFDFQIAVLEHLVSAPTCERFSLGYDVVQDGCYIEGARWQSLVSPEKMIPSGKMFVGEAMDSQQEE